MGWFDSQIRDRERMDNELFSDAFVKIAGSVMGTNEYAKFLDANEQSQSALSDILKYYHITPKEIDKRITDFNEQIEHHMRPNGIMNRVVKLTEGWSSDASGPMLMRLVESEDFVAVLPGKISGYTYFDRLSGKEVKIGKSNEKLFKSEAICFYKPFPLKSLTIVDLMKYVASTFTGSDFAFILIVSGIATLLGLLLPKLSSMLIANASDFQNIGFASTMIIFFACTTISSLIFESIKGMLTERVEKRMSLAVESATMMRILSLPASFFKKYSSGELSSRSSYMNSLCELLVSTIISTGLTSLFSLVYITQIFSFAPALVVPSIMIILVTVIFSVVSALVQMRIDKKTMELTAKEQGMSYALISGIQKIKLAGAEKRAFSKWTSLYAEEADLLYNPPMFIKINAVISLAITLIGQIVLYSGAIASGVGVSEYYAFNVAYGLVSGAFMSLAGIALTASRFKPIVDMVKPLLETVPEVSEGKKLIEKLSGNIELDHVSFRYNDDMPMIIDDLSLHIRSGQYVAIVGKTGCGKSTLMRLLLGFEEPSKGAVYYDKKDIKNIDLRSLRRRIGVVMQNGSLFAGDIYSNIVISAPWLTVDDAWEAARIADIADTIEEMPMGMFTFVTEGSGGISGGQKQRLMIARAIAPKPRILMLDEATSALDNISQKKISEALDKLDCTRIVIAHRLSTIRQCDRIIVLDGGKIIEDGTYDQLIAKNGYFADLVEHQRIDD